MSVFISSDAYFCLSYEKVITTFEAVL